MLPQAELRISVAIFRGRTESIIVHLNIDLVDVLKRNIT